MSNKLPEVNRVLALLPDQEFKRLLAKMEPVTLDFKQVLYERGGPIQHVFFPTSGVVSWLAADDHDTTEAATIGNEGMVGFRVLLGADTSAAKVMVQVPGAALRMKNADLKAERKHGAALINILYRYLNAFLTQVTQSVVCNTLHPLEKRFCRWLLMTHDRVRTDHIPLTHELLAQMLGVRRASVTVVARKLQNAGLIRYVHGKITILDRAALEAASCGCYHVVKEDYDRLLR